MAEPFDECIGKLKLEVEELKLHRDGYMDGIYFAAEYFYKTLMTVEAATDILQQLLKLAQQEVAKS